MIINSNELNRQLEQLSGWQREGNTIVKEFVFDDFKAAFAFMTAAAKEAEALNHHPDWSNSYNKVCVSLSSHDAGGVTEKDIELAQKLEAIVRA